MPQRNRSLWLDTLLAAEIDLTGIECAARGGPIRRLVGTEQPAGGTADCHGAIFDDGGEAKTASLAGETGQTFAVAALVIPGRQVVSRRLVGGESDPALIEAWSPNPRDYRALGMGAVPGRFESVGAIGYGWFFGCRMLVTVVAQCSIMAANDSVLYASSTAGLVSVSAVMS